MSQAFEPLRAEAFDAFAAYLRAHVAENGSPPVGYFQPLPRGTPLPDAFEANFRQGLAIPIGTPGWRRAWLARDARGEIAGHVDLRAHREPHTTHRCLLGMGVRGDLRGRGIGARLLAHATDWARAEPSLEWMDLMVLENNAPAVALYRRAGFTARGTTPDHFRVDGQRLASLAMNLTLKAAPSANAR
jgi:ribosomal protein S18 acetylase RimI-like enzyme